MQHESQPIRDQGCGQCLARAGSFVRGFACRARQEGEGVGRLLFGKVLDPQDNPLPDAIVYVTNTRTRAVKTYIVGPDGTYRFPALSTAVDYEVYAQFKGHKERYQVGEPVRRPVPGLSRLEG